MIAILGNSLYAQHNGPNLTKNDHIIVSKSQLGQLSMPYLTMTYRYILQDIKWAKYNYDKIWEY